MSATFVTGTEIMDRSAVLMNDPSKTDYNYSVLGPFLKMAMDEMIETLIDGQQPQILATSPSIIVPIGTNAIYSSASLNTPNYPDELSDIQDVKERLAGSNDIFISLDRREYIDTVEPSDRLHYWAWMKQVITFNPRGATTVREVQINYLLSYNLFEESNAEAARAPANSRTFLSYKTAALAAQFIGENPERAKVLEYKAEVALEKLESISNKGRQQLMTRHRPFRASYKARGGF